MPERSARPTAAEFYDAYAKRSGITERALADSGRRAYRCNCGDDICEGWQMLNEGDVQFDRDHGIGLYVEPDDFGYAPQPRHR